MDEERKSLLIEPRRPRVRKWPLVLFTAMQACTLGLVFFALCSPQWFQYCWFMFGLLSAKNTSLKNSSIHLEVDKMRDHFCDGGDYESSAEKYCPGLCSHLKDIERAGGILLFFIMFTVVTSLISIVLHIAKTARSSFSASYARLFTLLPFFSLFIGAITYTNVISFGNLLTAHSADLCKEDRTVSFNFNVGALLALISPGAQFITSLFGFFVAGKEFKKVVRTA